MGAPELLAADAVSPVLADVHAQYGAAFEAAIARNVADALEEDVGPGDQTGRLVPADPVVEVVDCRVAHCCPSSW